MTFAPMRRRSRFRAMLPAPLWVLAACGAPTPPPSPPAQATAPDDSQKDSNAPVAPSAPARALPIKAEAPSLRLDHSVSPLSYRAELDLDPDADSFSAAIHIELDIHQPISVLWLNGTDLDIAKASFSSQGQSWNVAQVDADSADFIGFDLGHTVQPGPATIAIDYRGLISSKDVSGAFKTQDRDTWYIFTQFEALSARRVLPSFDEPRFKVPWQLTIHAPEGQRALSNTPLVQQSSDTRPGRQTFTFAPSKPMPSYLVAFAVGPFEFVDLGKVGRAKVPARIVVPRGRTGETGYAARTTVAILDLLEDYFDQPYPYAKLDSIAVPKIGFAMEHPGLITYNFSRLLSAPESETPAFHRASAGVIAHELAHQWFGNLVTLAWWDDLWLNESFATWVGRKLVSEWQPTWQGAAFSAKAADGTMGVDSLISARKIRQEIADKNDIYSAFDGISYGKGAAILSMFEQWIGADTFREGVRAYIKKHAWGVTTSDDFLAAIAEVSQPQLADSFRTFLNQTGVPVISMDLICERGAPPTLELSQERSLPVGSAGSTTDRTWQIPVCIKYRAGGRVHRQCTLLSEEVDEMPLSQARQCPTWILGNTEGAGYYRTAYAAEMQRRLIRVGPRLTVPERIRFVGDMRALVLSGKLELGEMLAMIPSLVRDGNPHLLGEIADMVADMKQHLVPDEQDRRYARFVRQTFARRVRTLGLRPKAGESMARRALRAQLATLVGTFGRDARIQRQAQALADTWLNDGTGIAAEMLEPVLTVAAYRGPAELHSRIEAAIMATDNPVHRRALVAALAKVPDPARVRANIALVMTGKIDIRDAAAFFTVPLAHPQTRSLIYQTVKVNFDNFKTILPRNAVAQLIGAGSNFCDRAHRDDIEGFFGPKYRDIPGGPRAYSRTMESIDLCIAFTRLHQPSVEAFLKRQ